MTQQIENGEKVPIQRIIRLYKAAFEEIDADICKIQSASDAVNKAELAALKRELAEAAVAAPDTARMRAIQNSISAYKFRIDRAELVKQRAYAHLMKAAGRAAAIIKPLLKDTYKAARYGTIDDIASGLDCGVDFSLVPERTINKIIEAPFHGKNYSQRVWDNTAETAGKAQKILTQGMVKGESYSKMARSLSKLCNNTFYNSFRLISTEAAHFTELGRFDAYQELGIKKYTYYATLGSKTCDVCGALDGRTFDTSAAREGENKPPIHPHCRCYTVVGDVKLKSRLARDPVSGKNYKVRGDMTYNEWTDSLSDEQRMSIKAYRNRHGDMNQYRKYIERLGEENMPKTFDLFQKMKYNETEKWDALKQEYRDNKYFLQEQLQYKAINGKNEFIPQNALIKNLKTIAGNGSNTPIRVESSLIKRYGGSVGEWKKRVGAIESDKYIFDVHWYELDGHQYETKMKFRKEK